MDTDTTRREHAAAEWAALRARLRTITPQAVGRSILTVAVGVVAIAVAVGTWPALLPFFVGGIIAYGLLPVVDVLDRFMPRAMAALLSVSAAVLAVGAVLVLVLPPLANAFVRFALGLPTAVEIDAALASLQDRLGSLPEGTAAVAAPILGQLAVAVRETLAGASGGLDDIVRSIVPALLGAVGALLGLIVLPTWMLTVMSEKHRARIAVDRRLAGWLRTDAWAIAAIVDRAAGAYVRGYVIVAGLVGLLTYAGLSLSSRVGGPVFQEPLALSALAGAVQVIPVIGPLLGFLPVLLLLAIDPARAGVYLAVYLGARFIGASLLGARLMERKLGVHPAILVPGVVMIGQAGLLALLLSAPIIAIAVNVVRYVHGRLSEPARPAGVLPGSPVRARALGRRPSRVASVYRPGVPPAPVRRTTPSTAPAPTP